MLPARLSDFLVTGVRRVLCPAMLAVLAACGGGGGGSDSGGNAGMQIRFDRATVEMTAQENQLAGQGAQVINATAVGGSASEPLFIGAELQGVGVLAPIAVAVDTTARTAQITLAPNSALAAGTYSGTVRLLACKDPQCAAHHIGSPFTVSYTTIITPRFKAAVSRLDFAAAETVRPAAQTLQVTLPQGVAASTLAIEYEAGMAPWLLVAPQGSNFTVQPQSSLGLGTHTAVLKLEAGAAHPQLRIPVQYRVSAGLVVAAGRDLTLDSRSPASATDGDVAIDAAAGVGAAQWFARSSQPWLRLAATAGALGTPLRWQIDPQAFAALTNETTHEAIVTISAPGTSLAEQTWRLRLTKDVAELLAADTLAVLEGEAGEVLLFGRRLDQLAQPAAQLVTPGFTPRQVAIRSASLMALQVPALATGTYDIALQTSSGLPTRSVRLVVAAAQERQELWVNSSGLKGALLWDAANGVAFAVDVTQGAVVRIRPTGAAAAATLEQSSRAIANLSGIALSPDRRSLIATTTSGQLLELSPQDLSTIRSREFGRMVGRQWPQHLPLIVTADRWLLATGGDQWSPVLAYDLERSAAVSVGPGPYTFHSGPWGLVSPNGQRALVTQTAGLTPRPPLLRRDGVDAELRAFPASKSPEFFYHATTDRRGTRWLLDNRIVVDFDLNVLGELPVPIAPTWYPHTSAMSRDGSRVYVFAVNEWVSDSRIFVFDTSTPVGAGRVYPLLGFIQPLLSPSCLSPTLSDNCNGYASRMVLADDDRTLILAGDRRLGLVPVPPALRGGVPNAQASRAPHALAVGQR